MPDTLTHSRLLEVLDYDADTGIFTYKVKPSRKLHQGLRAGYQNKHGYRFIRIDGNAYAEHRLAWFYHHGQMPTRRYQIDHINHIRDDNRLVNLRQVSISDNARNRRNTRKSNTGEYGIWYNKKTGKYVAYIVYQGRKVFQKTFDNVNDAIDARQVKLEELGFHKNHGK